MTKGMLLLQQAPKVWYYLSSLSLLSGRACIVAPLTNFRAGWVFVDPGCVDMHLLARSPSVDHLDSHDNYCMYSALFSSVLLDFI